MEVGAILETCVLFLEEQWTICVWQDYNWGDDSRILDYVSCQIHYYISLREFPGLGV
jgi:hypothetical protein